MDIPNTEEHISHWSTTYKLFLESSNSIVHSRFSDLENMKGKEMFWSVSTQLPGTNQLAPPELLKITQLAVVAAVVYEQLRTSILLIA